MFPQETLNKSDQASPLMAMNNNLFVHTITNLPSLFLVVFSYLAEHNLISCVLTYTPFTVNASATNMPTLS